MIRRYRNKIFATKFREVGINSPRYQLLGFVICGACAALGGLMTAALVTEASPEASPASIFKALSVIALAGVSLGGGRGSLPKVLVGAIILATISDGLTIAGVQPYWATVTTGVLMITALIVERLLSRAISDRLVATGGLSTHAKKYDIEKDTGCLSKQFSLGRSHRWTSDRRQQHKCRCLGA